MSPVLMGVVTVLLLWVCMCITGCGDGGNDETDFKVKDAERVEAPEIVKVEDGSGVEKIDGDWSEKVPTGESGTVKVVPSSGKPMDPKATYHATADEYARFSSMSAEDRFEFSKGFASIDDFNMWHNAAKAAYDKAHPVYELKPGEAVDLGN